MSTLRHVSLGCCVLAAGCHCTLLAKDLWLRRKGRAASQRPGRTSSESKEDFERSVSDEVNGFICKNVQDAARIASLFLTASTVYAAFSPVFDEITWNTDMQYLSETTANLCIVFIRLCPASVLGRILPLCYVMLMLCLVGYGIFVDISNVLLFVRTMTSASLLRIGLGMIFSQVFSSLVCNIAISVMNTYLFSRLEDEKGMEIGGVESMALYECIVTLFIFVLAVQGRRALKRECCQLMEIQSLSIESSAMTTLLELVCDVVVELDDSLHVTEQAPRLSAMLCTSRSSKGMDLVEHIHNDCDRRHFKKLLCTKADNAFNKCVPGALNVTLRDSMANNIPVEMFYVAFQSRNCISKTKFFVGIREIADQPVAQLPPSQLNPSVAAALEEGQGEPKPRTAMVHGTAPFAMRVSFDNESREHTIDCDASSTASSGRTLGTSASQWKSVDERFQLTSKQAKRVGVIELLMQWNISMPARSCCAFHAELADLRSLVKSMERLPCYSSFHLIGESQCTACGLVMLVDEEEHITHCNGAPLKHVRSRKSLDRRVDSEFAELMITPKAGEQPRRLVLDNPQVAHL